MENQKNMILAIVLSLSFLVIWSMFVVPRLAPKPSPAAPVMEPAASPGDTPNATPTSPAKTGLPAKAVSLENSVLRDTGNEVTLNPLGGGIQNWRMKSKGQDVELVLFPDQTPLPLTTFSETPFNITTKDHQAIMEGTLANGLRVTKTLTLNPNSHLHTISLRFKNPTAQPIEMKNWEWGWGPGLGTVESERKENPRLIRVLSLGKLKMHTLKETEQTEFGRWVGIDNRYFMVAFLPTTDHPVQVQIAGKKDQSRLRIFETTTVPARGDTVLTYELYVGPKGYTQLKTYGKNLEEGVDFGTFSQLGKLILSALYRVRSWTGNYGVAIILLTIAIQILLLPLSIKSFKAAMAMRAMQPKIAELQARFKNDPKRLNVEMMNMYKTSGSNPFGGCLPMLLQLPIFWALFTTLRNAYELRGAPFVGWIHDLSIHDPYYILPVIMGGGMFFQQRMSGAVSDPTQRQMMIMMPIMFTVMFMNFPAGLVLYWLTNSLCTMGFQYVFQRTHATPTPSVVNTSIVK